MPGIPLLMLIGFCGVVAWVVTSNIQGSRADWSVALILWSALLFVFAIAGLLVSYWLPRIVSIRRSLVRYVPDIDDWTVAITANLPLAVLITLFFQVNGLPVWLYVLGAVSVVLGAAAFIDQQRVTRRPKKRKGSGRG
ncbi:MAG: hypothetical protein ACRDQX_04650 [Pseudonocardiaceae bacterium]